MELEDHPDLAAELPERLPLQTCSALKHDAVDGNLPGLKRLEAGNRAEQGGLPGARRSHDGDDLAARLVSGPAHGTLNLFADGSFTYTANADYVGADSFSYQASDGQRPSNVARVQITVTSANEAPVAEDFSALMNSTSLIIDVLDHSSDANGDPLTVVSVTQAQNGVVTINADQTVTYSLTHFFTGVDTFMYTVSDAAGATDSGTVTVEVQLTSSQGIGIIASQINALNLNGGNTSSLLSKLNAAQQATSSGNTKAAANQFNAAIKQIQALANSGRLGAVTASSLMTELRNAIDLL
jgi:hypothetical protein